MELAYEALEAWRTNPDLQDATGQRHFHESGWIMLNSKGSDLAERIRKNFRDRGGDVTSDVEIDEALRTRWDGLLEKTDMSNMDSGYWNPDAGWADAGDAVTKMLECCVSRGVKYECGDVDTLILRENRVCGVKTKDGKVYEADKILLATGAWTSQLLSPIEDMLNISEDDRIERQVTAAGVCVAHYNLDSDEYERLRTMPVLIYGDKGEVLPPPRSSRLLKFTNARSFTNTVTTSTGHKLSAPPDRDQTLVSEQLKKETLNCMIEKTIPGFVDRPVAYWRLCWDAITPTQDQLITQHPDTRLANLYLAVGGSFHSWKFLPIIGKYVVNVLFSRSNGEEKDRAWAWKLDKPLQGRGAHEKVVPKRELHDIDGVMAS